MKSWSAPKIWLGETAYILGGGPSLRGVDLSGLHGRNAIAINQAFKLGPWPVLFWGDCCWLEPNKESLDRFTGMKVTCCRDHSEIPNVLWIERDRENDGVSTDPCLVRWNLSAGGAAINLAYHFGASQIVLLGYDMRRINGKDNWHADYGMPRIEDPYERFLFPFPKIAEDLDGLGVNVLNATPGSALKVWPIVDPKDVIPTVEGAQC